MTAYASWSVVFGEQPSAAKWNILGTNDASFNDGTGIGSGVITYAKLLSTIFSGQISTGVNAGTGGGDTNLLNLGGLKLSWGLTASSAAIPTNGAQNLGVTFPTTYAAAPKVYATNTDITLDNRLGNNVLSTTTTTTVIAVTSFAAGATATSKAAWLAIGT